MSLAENISERLSFKASAAGTLTAGTLRTPDSDPNPTGGQQLRFVSHNLSLTKDTYESNEKRTDRQIADFRHGVRRVQGTLSGLLSPLTYEALLEAVLRGTWTTGVSITQADVTDIAATGSTFVVSSGDLHTLGLRIGHIIRFASLSETANNSKNFLITGMSGGNRTITVYPTPTTMSADSSFTLTSEWAVNAPASSHVSRLFAFESYQSDVTLAELFQECRIGGFSVGLPATGNATCEFQILGRGYNLYDGSMAPFFSAPTAQTSTGLCQAVNGALIVSGTAQGVLTSLNLRVDLAPNAPPVVGQNFPPEIFLGPLRVSGDMTVFFQDGTFINYFDDETEIGILAYLTTSSIDAAEAISFYIPRAKLGSATKTDDGSGGKILSCSFVGLKYATAAAGVPATTIQICDTEVSS